MYFNNLLKSVFTAETFQTLDRKRIISFLLKIIYLAIIAISISVKLFNHYQLNKYFQESIFLVSNSILWLLFLFYLTILYSKIISHFSNIVFIYCWNSILLSLVPFFFLNINILGLFRFSVCVLILIVINIYYLSKYKILTKILAAFIPKSVESIIALIAIVLMSFIISNNLFHNGIQSEDDGTIEIIGERIAIGQTPTLEWNIGAPDEPYATKWDLVMPFTYLAVAIFFNLFPSHETLLIVNVLFFICFGIIFYKVLKYFFNTTIALWTLILIVFNPLTLWVVRSGLPYIISWTFIILSCFLYFYAHKNNNKSFFLLTGITIAISIFSVPFISFVILFPILLELFSLFNQFNFRSVRASCLHLILTAVSAIIMYVFFSICFYHYTNGISLGASLIQYLVRIIEVKAVNTIYVPPSQVWPTPINVLIPLIKNLKILPEYNLLEYFFRWSVLVFSLIYCVKFILRIIKNIKKEHFITDIYNDIFIVILFVVYLVVFSVIIPAIEGRWILGYLILLYTLIAKTIFNAIRDYRKWLHYGIDLVFTLYIFFTFFVVYPQYSNENVSPYKCTSNYIKKLTNNAQSNVLCITKDATFLVATLYINNIVYLNKKHIIDMEAFASFIVKYKINFIFYNNLTIDKFSEQFWPRSNRELELVELFIEKNKLRDKLINIGNFRLLPLSVF